MNPVSVALPRGLSHHVTSEMSFDWSIGSYSGEARYGLKFTSLTAWCRVISFTDDVITDDVIIDFIINNDVIGNDHRFHEFYDINYIWINYELLGTMENISADQQSANSAESSEGSFSF